MLIGRSFKPRLDLSKSQTNVIMLQIKAEKQNTRNHKNKQGENFKHKQLTPTRQSLGKKHFPQRSHRLTDITNTFTNEFRERSISRSQGKKILNHAFNISLDSARSDCSGRKKHIEKRLEWQRHSPLVAPQGLGKSKSKSPAKKSHRKRQIIVPDISFTKRRADRSPVNQNRESADSPLNFHNRSKCSYYKNQRF